MVTGERRIVPPEQKLFDEVDASSSKGRWEGEAGGISDRGIEAYDREIEQAVKLLT